MKKLFLINGMEHPVEILTEQRVICLSDYDGNRIANIDGKDNTVTVMCALKWYEVKAIAEIVENFNQYFNTLTQYK